jgi:hypothetical protein
LVKEEGAFLKKSAAKNFCYFRAGMFQRHWPRLTEVFFARVASLLFLQKKKRFLSFL